MTRRAHAFVTDLAAPELSQRDRHHIERVLRLRAGDEMTVSDGIGSWRLCRFGPELEPVAEALADPEPSPRLTVGFALVKGERPELVVQKLTELGIDRIIPFTAARSVVRWEGAKAERAHERLTVVSREAAMQSRATRLPTIEQVLTFAAVAVGGTALCERGGATPTLALPSVLVGPEGGWAHEELAVGLPTVALGPTVLRAETATLAAASILGALRAGIVAGVSGPAEA
ncbi:MAG: RsmE family RNA methyltransferase [Acidimicrobiales bacterium]